MYIVSNAGSVLGFVALIVAAVAVAYSALNRTTISTLKDSNAAQAERITILESESARDKHEIRRITTENQVLRGVVTGSEQLAAIRTELVAQGALLKRILDILEDRQHDHPPAPAHHRPRHPR
jgi:Tfp pilus assembly protein PilV